MRKKDASVRVLKLTYSALYLAIALVLPFLTGQIPQIGSMLCPMHIPALLCGFVCGWPWGLAVGFISPLLRSVLFGMPDMFPTAVAMAFELAAYGAASGLLYRVLPKKIGSIYAALVLSMIAGRLVWVWRVICWRVSRTVRSPPRSFWRAPSRRLCRASLCTSSSSRRS